MQRGMTTTFLADQSGISQGYLSKIENSQNAPPVSTLGCIAKSLGIKIADIFMETDPQASICLTRINERQPINFKVSKFGYTYFPLAPQFPNRRMDPYIMIAGPSAEKSKTAQHKGEEWMLVLEGTLMFVHGENEYILEEGDSVYWDASVPFSVRAYGSEKVTVVAAIHNDDEKPE